MAAGDADVVPFEGGSDEPSQPGDAPGEPGGMGPGRPDGVTVTTIIMAVLGLLSLLGASVMVAMPSLFPMPTPPSGPDMGGLFAIIGGFLAVIAILQLLAAWGVHDGRSWGRILAMAMAVVSLISFPIGTVLGIVVLYYMTRDPVKRYFEAGDRAARPA